VARTHATCGSPILNGPEINPKYISLIKINIAPENDQPSLCLYLFNSRARGQHLVLSSVLPGTCTVLPWRCRPSLVVCRSCYGVPAVSRDATGNNARGRQYDPGNPDLVLRHCRRASRGQKPETAAALQSGSRKLRCAPVIQRIIHP
jgi:hypothetical protein